MRGVQAVAGAGMDEHEAERVALRAAIDQACMMREEQAREAGAYLRALRAEGIPRVLAWLMVRDWNGYRCWNVEVDE